MSDENTTGPAWLASQQPAAESTAPKSRRPRRTKAQMAEARATIAPPDIATTMAAEDTAKAIAVDLSRALGPRSRIEFIRRHHPTFIACAALALATAALVK